jgi:hypothetical protein
MPGLSLHAESARQLVIPVPPIQDVYGCLDWDVVEPMQYMYPINPVSTTNPHRDDPHNPSGSP